LSVHSRTGFPVIRLTHHLVIQSFSHLVILSSYQPIILLSSHLVI